MKTVHTKKTYNNYLLSTAKNSEGHYLEYLQSIYSFLTYVTQKYKNIFIVNFVVKYPSGSDYPHDNDLFLRFIENFSLHCKEQYSFRKYLWVRERSLRSGGFHFHVLYAFQLRQIRNGYGLSPKLLELWKNCLNISDASGLVKVWPPKREENQYANVKTKEKAEEEELYKFGGVKLQHSDSEFDKKFAIVLKNSSYLAKVYSKGYSPYKVNEFGMSNLD